MMIFLAAGLVSAFSAATAAFLAGKSFYVILFAYSAGGMLGGLLAVMAVFALRHVILSLRTFGSEPGNNATASAS